MDIPSSQAVSDGQQLILDARSTELNQIVTALKQDQDLIVAGVSGSGRQFLVEVAAQKLGFKTMEVDCIRAISPLGFLRLLIAQVSQAFESSDISEKLLQGPGAHFFAQEPDGQEQRRLRLVGPSTQKEQKEKLLAVLEMLIDLIEELADIHEQYVVMILKNFTHLQSWDRDNNWSNFLKQRICEHSHFSYVLTATFGELKGSALREGTAKIIKLPYLNNGNVRSWAREEFRFQGLSFDADDEGLECFYRSRTGTFWRCTNPSKAIAISIFSPRRWKVYRNW